LQSGTALLGWLRPFWRKARAAWWDRADSLVFAAPASSAQIAAAAPAFTH